MSETEYTSLARVVAALEHKEPDRIPLDLGGSCVTAISKQKYVELRKYLGLPDKALRIHDKTFQTAWVDDDVVEKMGIDVQSILPEEPMPTDDTKPDHVEGKYLMYTDVDGYEWRMPLEGGHYFDNINHPLADAEEIEDLDRYPWFDFKNDPRMYGKMRARSAQIMQGYKRAHTIQYPGNGIFEKACNLLGHENFYVKAITDKPFIHALMRRCMEQRMGFWEACLEQVGENVVVCAENDDMGTQRGPFLSPELYAELVHPYHKELFSFIKKTARSKAYIFLHSCGSVKSLIPSFIEEGVDILNPIQINAEDMDPKVLKQEFGRDITFWGGGIETQKILPFGTEQEVRDEVKRRIEELAPGGGFVFTQVHNIVSNVPMKNVIALYEAFYDNCKY